MSVIVEIADAVAAAINDGTYAEPVLSGADFNAWLSNFATGCP